MRQLAEVVASDENALPRLEEVLKNTAHVRHRAVRRRR